MPTFKFVVMQPGDPTVGIYASTVDVAVEIQDDTFEEHRAAFEESFCAFLAGWYDVKPNQIITAETLAKIEEGEAAMEAAADAAEASARLVQNQPRLE